MATFSISTSFQLKLQTMNAINTKKTAEDSKSNEDEDKVERIQSETRIEDQPTLKKEEEEVQDGIPEESDAMQEEATDNQATTETSDLFKLYSNDNVRMWALLRPALDRDDVEEEQDDVNIEDNTRWQQLTGYQGRRRLREEGNDQITRKTKLSTELHSEVYMNMFLGNEE